MRPMQQGLPWSSPACVTSVTDNDRKPSACASQAGGSLFYPLIDPQTVLSPFSAGRIEKQGRYREVGMEARMSAARQMTLKLAGMALLAGAMGIGSGNAAPSGSAPARATAGQVQAEADLSTRSGCVFDLTLLPRFSGKVERLLPGTQGDAVGALLTDGTEVEMPPGLAAQDHHLRAGSILAVKGLAAPSLHLVRAFALSGKQDLCASPLPELVTAAPPASAEGKIARLLHDGDGALNGAILTDGTVIRVPAAGARTQFLKLNAPLYAEGYGYQTAYGKLVVAKRLGPDRLQAIHISDEPPIPRGAPPGSSGYDHIDTPGGTE